MSSKLCAAGMAVLLASAVAAARAQPSSPAPAASGSATGSNAAAAIKPASNPSSIPPTGAAGYRSAFDGYRPFAEQPIVSWREANDLVGRIGGWQAYAREGQGGQPEGDDKTPMPASHGGMSMPSGKGTPAPLSPAASSPAPSPAPVKVNPVAPVSGGTHSGHKTP